MSIGEAWFTFGNFVVLIVICYLADRYKGKTEARKKQKAKDEEHKKLKEEHDLLEAEKASKDKDYVIKKWVAPAEED